MEQGSIKIEDSAVLVNTVDSDVWMTQNEIAELFGVFISSVGSNIKVILKSNILCESKVICIHRFANGSFVEKYNLEMIAALAFRINSRNTKILRKWIIKKIVARLDITQVGIVVDFDSETYS